VVRRIFGPKREEVMRGWRRLHNEELHNLYTSPNIIRLIKSSRMSRTGNVACTGETRNAYKFWPENVKRRVHSADLGVDVKVMDLREIGWEVVDLINLAQDGNQWRFLVNTVMDFAVPYKARRNFLTS
jgi:hypothetical protein